MNRFEKMNYELNEFVRDRNLPPENSIYVSAGYLSLGYYDSKNNYKNIESLLREANIKEGVNELFIKIEEEIPFLKGVYERLNRDNYLTDVNSYGILSLLYKERLNPDEYQGLFENMLDATSTSLRDSMYNSTPHFINNLGIRLLGKISGSFYDGVSGLGGSILEVNQIAKNQEDEVQLFGQEINEVSLNISKLRMYIHQIQDVHLELGNTLVNPKFTENNKEVTKFDRIMMCPPFGINWNSERETIMLDSYNRFIYGTPRLSNSEPLFLSHMMGSLKDNGKGVMLVSSGMLFATAGEAVMRRRMILSDQIEAVISLPARLLHPYTQIQTHLIVVNKNKEESMRGKIQFINAEHLYKEIRRQRILEVGDIDKIVDVYQSHSTINEFSVIIDHRELEDEVLLPSRYVSKTEFHHDQFGTVKMNTNELSKLKDSSTLGDVSDFYRGINVVGKDIVEDENGIYQIINMGDVQNGEIEIDNLTKYSIKNNARVEAYVVEAGDIIISSKGTSTKIAIVPPHKGKVLLSHNFIGIHLKNQSAEYVKQYLESPLGQYLINARKVGSALVTLNPKDLKSIPLLLPNISLQREIIESYNEQEHEIEVELLKLKEKQKALKTRLYQQMDIAKTFNVE